MVYETPSHESSSEPFNIRPDVVEMLRTRPFMTFEDVYDQLKEAGADKLIFLLEDAQRYSEDTDERHAFAAGILHVLAVQLASREFDSLEESLRLSLLSDDVDAADQQHSGGLDGDQPAG